MLPIAVHTVINCAFIEINDVTLNCLVDNFSCQAKQCSIASLLGNFHPALRCMLLATEKYTVEFYAVHLLALLVVSTSSSPVLVACCTCAMYS